MATVTRYLKASNPGSDPEVYTSLSAWQTAEATNLVSDGDIHVLECDAFTLSEAFTFSGWTTGVSNYIIIRPASGHEHGGVPGAGFVLTTSGNYKTTLQCGQAYTRIEGIEVRANGTVSANCIGLSNADPIYVDGCIVSGGTAGISTVSASSIFRNCLAHDTGNGFQFGNWNAATAKNCTAADCTNGFIRIGASGSGPTVINCVAYNNTTDFNYDSVAYSGSSNYNASKDATAPGANSVTGLADADFTDPSSDDWSIPNTSSDLYDAGTTPALSTDIAGVTWTTDDIGAYAYVGGGGPTTEEVSASFGVDAGTSYNGGATADGAFSGAVSVGVNLASVLVVNASISGPVEVGASIAADAAAEAAVSGGVEASSSLTAGAQAEAATTQAIELSDVQAAQAQAEASTTQGAEAGYAVTGATSAGGDINESLVFGTTLNATKTAEATAYATAIVGAGLTVSVDASVQIDAALTAGATAGTTIISDVSIEGAITIGAEMAAQVSAEAQASAAVLMTQELATQIVAEVAAEAGITIAQVLGVTFAGSSISGDLVTPDGRKFTVTAEVRAFTVSAESRTFTVH